MTKKRFHTSLQLKLTLLLSLLMIVSCVLMYFFISHSAVSGMDGLQNYMIKVDPQDGDSPITFNVDPKALFPQFEQEIQETKEDFLLRSVIATTIIILLSSVCTYFLTKKTLTPLQKLTSEVSQIQAQNLSTHADQAVTVSICAGFWDCKTPDTAIRITMVKRNIFTLILLFMYFINAISYSSDGINVIPCQLFPKILNVCIHNPVFSKIISTPHSIQKLIPG